MDNFLQIILNGFGAAIVAAILFGVRNIFDKHLTQTKKLSLFVVLIGQFFFVMIFILIFAFFKNELTANIQTIFFALIGSIILSTGVFFQLKAITIEDFSLTLPFMSFTFIFLIPIEYLFFHQLPTMMALVGLAMIFAGTFWLGFVEAKKKKQSWNLSKGTKLMILVAFIYSVAGVIDKAGSISSTPLGYLTWLYCLIFFIYLFIFNFFKKKKHHQEKLAINFKKYWLWFLAIGLISCFASWLLMNAYLDIMVNYAIAIKRVGLLIPIILGPLIFKEKHLSRRIPGILLMLGGAVVIILFG